ncbi:hypothetical protein STEG23_017005 [Scotinomys teguina]
MVWNTANRYIYHVLSIMIENNFEEWVKFVYMVYYIDRFSYVEPSLHLWDEAYLVMVDNVFDVFVDLDKNVSIFFILFKEPTLCLIESLLCSLCFYFIDFSSQFDYFLASVSPGFLFHIFELKFSLNIPCLWLSPAMIKHHHQKQLGKERFILVYMSNDDHTPSLMFGYECTARRG